MSRKRTPSPEQQKTDRVIATALAHSVDRLAQTYPSEFGLLAAQRGLHEFANSAVQQPKPRTRNAKPAPQSEQHHFLDTTA